MSVATSLGEPCIAGSAYFMDLAIANAFACTTSNSASDKILAAVEIAFGSIASASFHTCLLEERFQRSFRLSNSVDYSFTFLFYNY